MEIQNPEPIQQNIDNTIPPQQEVNVILPLEEPKKSKKGLFLIIILILLILFSFGIMAFFFFRNDEEPVEMEIEVKEEVTEVQEEQEIAAYSLDTEVVEECVKVAFEKHEIDEYDEDVKEVDSTEKYGGMRWKYDDGEIGLIKKYKTVFFDIYSSAEEDDIEMLSYAKERLPMILNDVQKCLFDIDFVENENNFTTDILAFEKEDLVCFLEINTSNWPSLLTTCGELSSIGFPEGYSDISLFYGERYNIEMYNLVENFAVITKWPRPSTLGGGWAIVQKDELGDWEEIDFRQDLWDCELLFNANVPPELFEVESVFGTCHTYDEEYRDYYEMR